MSEGVIVVAGEALVDLVLAPGGGIEHHPGGGPYNVARALARLDQPVHFLGRISTDRLGGELLAALAADGVALSSVVATDAPTTLAIAEIGEAGAASYRFYVEGTSAPGLRAREALAMLPPRVDMLHVGTLGLILEPIATALEAVIAAVAADTLVALDPNCRPLLIADPAAYRARLRRILARTDVVKVSEEDLAWLEPDLAPVDAARTLLADGPPVALVTRGADGAIVVTARDAITVAAEQVEVVSTIGAGDAFGGAFLAWWRAHGLGRSELARLETVVEATEFASLVAARTCERAGAHPPRLSELGV